MIEGFLKPFLAVVLTLTVFCSFSKAQDCAPPTIVANANRANLFSPEQEMILGELTIQNMVGSSRAGRSMQFHREFDVPSSESNYSLHLIRRTRVARLYSNRVAVVVEQPMNIKVPLGA
ncbi:MAG TPA: hypothetical protein VJ124_26385 [Pyrinomonadaceae bacterium]|nr:hypothetical protein [Pyrinomonadaceae bacterium]